MRGRPGLVVAVLAGALTGAAPPAEDPPVVAEVVVSATREPRPPSGVPTPVTVISAEELAASAAVTVDGVVRAAPSVATFRRSSSLVADPSSQGVNLRGIGPSGVGRGLVLDDGVPVNDPFGGWVYWRALSRLGTERLEIAPGGASALYGSFALGGVVERVARPIDRAGVALELAGGSFGTWNGAARTTSRWNGGGIAVEGEVLATDGFVVVAPSDRGPVDGPAAADHATLGVRAEHVVRPGLRLSAGADAFGEDQDGGTRFTRSEVRLGSGRAGLAWTGEAGRLALTLYGGARRFEQTRARVAEGRAAEALAARQEIPSGDLGLTLLWSGPPGATRHRLSAGVDVRRVSGTARERLFPADPDPARTVAREAFGAQVLGGVFVQDAFRVAPRLELAASVRADAWRNGEARIDATVASGAEERAAFPSRLRGELSPRVAALWRPLDALAVRASAYRAFRAPTLNELYRPFQVGTVLTAPNPALGAEVLTGAEAGPELALGSLALRATAFASLLDDPITTVTLGAPLPDGAMRRRENLGRARFRGVETELAARLAPWLRAGAAWTWVDARVVKAPAAPELVGKRVAQDPAHRLAATLALDTGGTALRVAVRYLSRQYEDDRNTLAMAGFTVVDLSAERRVAGDVALFATVENLLDRGYLVGRAGVDTVGQPLTMRAGLRYGFE
jgi:iron complex outermembrane recepter protein